MSVAATFAGHSGTATLKLLQERGETFRDALVGRIVLGPEPLPEFHQPCMSRRSGCPDLRCPRLTDLLPTTASCADPSRALEA